MLAAIAPKMTIYFLSVKKMKSLFKILVFTMSLIILNSCKNDDSTTVQHIDVKYKIMPLGASRVQGNRPIYESYRYELWKDLIENGYTFDYIGTQSDAASYSTFNNTSFDIDHEGRSGWTSGQILGGIDDWVNQAGVPDIVLFSSPGGNDAILNLPYAETISNINGIIDKLQAINPNIIIIIEQLAPLTSEFMSVEYVNYFSQLQQDMLIISLERSTTTSKIIAVDMFTEFEDTLLADGVHYNQAGASFVAARYYEVLVDVLVN